jgi:hypothetical protein
MGSQAMAIDAVNTVQDTTTMLFMILCILFSPWGLELGGWFAAHVAHSVAEAINLDRSIMFNYLVPFRYTNPLTKGIGLQNEQFRKNGWVSFLWV